MTLLLALTILLLIGNYFYYKQIHKYKVYLYIFAVILSAVSLTQEANLINLGYVGISFFLLVMFAGVVDKGDIKKSLLANRAEYAILGTIFILAHGVHYLISSVEYSYLFDGPLYFYIGIIALLIALPLFMTSFMLIRKKMKGKSWKKLHQLSRLFYALIGLHLILLQNTRMYFYIAIFSLYFVMKLWTVIEQKLKKASKPQAATTLQLNQKTKITVA